MTIANRISGMFNAVFIMAIVCGMIGAIIKSNLTHDANAAPIVAPKEVLPPKRPENKLASMVPPKAPEQVRTHPVEKALLKPGLVPRPRPNNAEIPKTLEVVTLRAAGLTLTASDRYKGFSYTEDDVNVATDAVYHESRGTMGDHEVGWRCVMDTLMFRKYDQRWKPSTIREVAYQERPIFAEDGSVLGHTRMYTGIKNHEKVKGKIDEPKVHKKIKERVRVYFKEMKEGKWRSICHYAHSMWTYGKKLDEHFMTLCPILSVVSFTSKGEKVGGTYFGDCL